MGKIKKLAGVTGVALAVGAAYYAHESGLTTVPPDPETYSRTADKSIVRDTAGNSINFWQQQGIGKVASVKVVELEGDKTLACGPTTIHSYDGFTFCNQTNTVILPAATANDVRNRHQKTPKAGDAALAGVTRIATAAYVLDNNPSLFANAPKTGNAEKDAQNKVLLQACIAGIEQAVIDKQDGEMSSTFVHDYIINSDGWPEETSKRDVAASFENGYAESARRIENDLPGSTDPALCVTIPNWEQ